MVDDTERNLLCGFFYLMADNYLPLNSTELEQLLKILWGNRVNPEIFRRWSQGVLTKLLVLICSKYLLKVVENFK